MISRALTIISVLFLAACTSSMQIVKVNPDTGYFPGDKKAIVIKSKKVNLDRMKGLVLTPNGGFTHNMVKNIGYFDRVISFNDLETIIIKKGLTKQVPSVYSRIGINQAAKAYKKFLQVQWFPRKDGRRHYMQLKLTDPITLEDLFVCETYLDRVWTGVNDHANWYPMMNAFIDYIKANSKTFK